MYPSTICTVPYQVCTRLWTVRSFLVIYGSMTIQVLAYGFSHPNCASARAVFMVFSLFFFCFFRPSFLPAIRLASHFPRAIIFDRLFGGETTLYLRLERPYYTPYYITAFLHSSSAPSVLWNVMRSAFWLAGRWRLCHRRRSG